MDARKRAVANASNLTAMLTNINSVLVAGYELGKTAGDLFYNYGEAIEL